MDALETTYRQFTDLLSDTELIQLADRYGVADQRERKLPLRIFFWLMVLSASQPTVRGGLFLLVAFFVAALSGLVPMAHALTLTKMALYHQRWSVEIFFHVYKHLLHIEHLIAQNTNGIMVEIYSALIFSL